ncbi:MAG TPA: class I SAM-dependent methyltransferase [Chloroflexota bacterium]|nr:class I SAM-dependent methyltransferase [Chloroflexota bacterium]
MDLYRKAWSTDESARRYERSRPGYAAEAVEFLQSTLGIGPGVRVLDIGAGTGKLTRQLVETGAAVTAVEPLDEMRRHFSTILPGVPILPGTAESIPLPDHSFDIAVSGQAWHWFEPYPAAREAARVLVPRGRLALLWNEHDESIEWVRELSALRTRARLKSPSHVEGSWRRPFAEDSSWKPLEAVRFRHLHRLSLDALVERVLSSSVFAALPPDEQRQVDAEVRAMLDHDPATRGRQEVDLPYVTEVHWTARLT